MSDTFISLVRYLYLPDNISRIFSISLIKSDSLKFLHNALADCASILDSKSEIAPVPFSFSLSHNDSIPFNCSNWFSLSWSQNIALHGILPPHTQLILLSHSGSVSISSIRAILFCNSVDFGELSHAFANSAATCALCAAGICAIVIIPFCTD